jgi:nitrite reductase/ring-hydroxylating ferredoxin subunit
LSAFAPAKARSSSRSSKTTVIACPWHKYEFSMKDGHCLTDAGLRVRSYPVTVEAGKVLVDMSGHRAGRVAKPAEAR